MPGVAPARAVAARAPAPKPAGPATAAPSTARHDSLGCAIRTLARLAPLAGVDARTVTLGLPGSALPPGARAATDGRSITLAPTLLHERPDDVPRVLAHELAHVAQLRGAAGSAPRPAATVLAEAGARGAARLMLAGQTPRIAPVAAPVPLFDGPAARPSPVPQGSFAVVRRESGYVIAVNGGQYKKWKEPVRELTALYVIAAYPGASREDAYRIAGETQGLYLESLNEGPPPADTETAAILVLEAAQDEVEQAIGRLGLQLRREDPPEGIFPLGAEQQAGRAPAGATGKPGTGAPVRQFEPEGKVEFRPPRDPFVTKGDIHAAFLFTGDDEGRLYNYHPFYNRVKFDWTVRRGPKVVDEGPFLEGRGDISYTFSVDDPGDYFVSVVVTSNRFRGGKRLEREAPFRAAAEETASKEAFRALAAGSSPDASFAYDDAGRLMVKQGAKARTIDEQLLDLHYSLGAVEAMVARGGKEGEEAADYVQYFKEQIKGLEELKQETAFTQTYLAAATFTDRETSQSRSVAFVLTGRWEYSGGEHVFTMTAYDFTFSPDKAIKHAGTGRVAAEGKSFSEGMAAAERLAMDDMADDWHSYNDYPYGSIRLATKLIYANEVRTTVIDTYNWKRTGRKVATGIALGGTAILLVASGGTAAPVSILVIEVAATAAGVALTADSAYTRYRNGQFHWFDRATVIDMLTLVPVAGQLARAGGVGIGRGLLLLNVGVGGANVVMISVETRAQIGATSAKYAALIERASDPAEKDRLASERDRTIAQILGGAAVSGGLALVTTAKGVKDVLSAPSATPRGTAPVEEPVPVPRPSATTEPAPAAKPPPAAEPPAAKAPPSQPPAVEAPPTQPPAAEAPPAQAPKAGEPAKPVSPPVTEGPPTAAEVTGIPKGGIPARERLQNPRSRARASKEVLANPDAYYYDPETKRFKPIVGESVVEGGAPASEQLRLREAAEAEMRAAAAERLKGLEAESEELAGLVRKREALQKERNAAILERSTAAAEERAATTPEEKAAARQRSRDARDRAKAIEEEIGELDSPREIAKKQAKLAKEMAIETIKSDPQSRAKLPCFAGETLVATTHGPQRIDRLRAGDPVWTFDFESGRPTVRRVTQTHLSRTDRFVSIDLDGAAVRATATHRFWVEDGVGWTLAHSLRTGMRVLGLDGRAVEVRVTAAQEAPAEPAFNLSIDGTATFFVGPGVLVHNAPVDVGLGGQFIIYRAVNRVASEFAGKTYVGQTTELTLKLTPRGTLARGGEHQSAARSALARHEAALKAGQPGLPAEQVEFYRFMKDAELEPLVKGIGTKAQADYLEQLNIELDRKVYGADKVMNRREQIASEAHMEAIVQEILKDEKVAKLYCPTG